MNALMSLILGAYVLIVLARVPELFPALAPLQLGKVTFLLGMAAALATRPHRLVTLWRDIPFGPPLLLLAFVAVCGIPFSVWRGGALTDLQSFVKTLCGFLLVVALAERGREHVLRLFILASVAVLAGLLVVDTGTGRLHVSSSYDPNDMALLFVVFLPIVTAEAMCANSTLIRLCSWGAAACSLVGIALTQSRGGLLALAAVAAHALVISKRQRWLLVPLLALGAAIIMHTADDSLWSRFQDLRSQEDYNYSSDDGRLTIWKEGLWLFAQRPLLGVGIGQFSTGLAMFGNGLYKTAHNSFLQLGAELGIVGFLAFLTVLWRAFRIALAGRVSPLLPSGIRHSALLLALTGYCTGGFFLSQAYGNILYTLLALSAVTLLERRRLERAVPVPRQEKTALAEPPVHPPTPAAVLTSGLMQKADTVRKARTELQRRGEDGLRRAIPGGEDRP